MPERREARDDHRAEERINQITKECREIGRTTKCTKKSQTDGGWAARAMKHTKKKSRKTTEQTWTASTRQRTEDSSRERDRTTQTKKETTRRSGRKTESRRKWRNAHSPSFQGFISLVTTGIIKSWPERQLTESIKFRRFANWRP